MNENNETDTKEKERLLHNALIYMKIYDSLIERAIPRGLEKDKNSIELTEIHHIVPKCLGGTDDKFNLVQLTTREHVIAHMLLQRMYPENEGLSCAITLMFSSKGNGTKYVSTKTVSIFREETRKLLSEKRKGRKLSEETKRKIGLAHLGNKYSLGHICSEETKEKLRVASTGKKHTEEAKRKISESNKGNKYCLGRIVSEETREKLRKSALTKEAIERVKKVHIGKIVSGETREKQRKAALGNKKRLGKGHTEETKQKLREANLGKNSPKAISIIDNRVIPSVIYWTKTDFIKQNKISLSKLNKLLKDPNSGIELYNKIN